MSTPTTPAKTLSGIQEKADERVIPMTRRPDGTYRKERKVRPGYTPPEDVARYSNQVLASARPVAAAAPANPASNTPMSKAQKKNEKRKAKRKEDSENPADKPEDKEDVDTKSQTELPAPVESTPEPAAPVDTEKKLRALSKKLRQVEQLKERQDKGEEMLPEQIEKLSKMDELVAQIKELSL